MKTRIDQIAISAASTWAEGRRRKRQGSRRWFSRHASALVTPVALLLATAFSICRSAAQTLDCKPFEGGHTAAITSLAYSPDGHWAITGGADGQAIVWNLVREPFVYRSQEFWPTTVYPAEQKVRIQAEIAPDGSGNVLVAKHTLVWMRNPNPPGDSTYWTVGCVQLFDRFGGGGPNPGEPIRDFTWYFEGSSWPIPKHGKGCVYAQFTPSNNPMEIYTAQRWGRASEARVVAPIRYLYVSPAYAPSAYLPETEPIPTDMSRDGTLLVGVDWLFDSPTTNRCANYATLVDAHTGLVIRHLYDNTNPTNNHNAGVTDAKFSPDGSCVVTVSADSTAQLWATNGIHIRRFSGWHNEAINSVAFSPTGTHFLTGSDDGKVHLWSTNSDVPFLSFQHWPGKVSHVAFSPLGDTFLTSAGNNAYMWSGFSYPTNFFELVLNVGAGGTVNATPPPGPNGKYVEGTRVRLVASPRNGYLFNRWGLDGAGTNPTLDTIMDRNKVISALFAPATAPPEISIIAITGRQFTVEWIGGGTLERADSIAGPWQSTGDSDGTHQAEAVGSMRFFRVVR